jgi:anti-sigma regulatory factor (Ser/Thr protein kinase)
MAAAGTHEITESTQRTELTLSFPAERHSPGRARRLIACELRRWGHHEALVDDAVLVVSELASNAVIHACSPFTVSIQSRDSLLRIAVRDAVPVPAAANGHRGLLVRAPHGLAAVQALADQWGVEPTADADGKGKSKGKIVWAELRIF